MLHAAWWSPLGPLGVSPLQQLGVTLSIEDAAQRYQRSMFRNGARPPSAITADEEFLGSTARSASRCWRSCARTSTDIYAARQRRQARAAAARARLEAGRPHGRRGRADRAAQGRPRGGLRRLPDPAAVPRDPRPRDVQQHPTLREVAYTDGLGPPLVLIEQTINAQLVRALLREDDVFVEFDFAGVLRGDRLKEMQALREAIGIGLMTRNEGRSVLNMPRPTRTAWTTSTSRRTTWAASATSERGDRGRRRRPTIGPRVSEPPTEADPIGAEA
jgi:hypothetical protein